MPNIFKFKQFDIEQERSSMKVNTDGVLLGAWAKVTDDSSILDIGCGNGLIALMLAQRNPKASITGVEIDEGSYLDAKLNLANFTLSKNLEFELISIQDFAKVSNKVYDHIVSNPPFFSGGTFSTNENKANVRHTVKLPHGDLLIAVTRLLAKGGKFSVILPEMEGLRFVELAKRSNLFLTDKCIVYTRQGYNPERLLLTFSNEEPKSCNESSILIHDQDGNGYTSEYINLTKDFYLKM